jgi:hypothetical protein
MYDRGYEPTLTPTLSLKRYFTNDINHGQGEGARYGKLQLASNIELFDN